MLSPDYTPAAVAAAVADEDRRQQASRTSIYDYSNELENPEEQDLVQEFERTITDFGDYLKYGPLPAESHANGTASAQPSRLDRPATRSLIPVSTSSIQEKALNRRLDLLLNESTNSTLASSHPDRNGDSTWREIDGTYYDWEADDDNESLPPIWPTGAPRIRGDDVSRLQEAVAGDNDEADLSVTSPPSKRYLLRPGATFNGADLGTVADGDQAISVPDIGVEETLEDYYLRHGVMIDRPELHRKIRELWSNALNWKDFSQQYPRHYQDLKRELQYPAILHDAFERFNVRFNIIQGNACIIYPRYRRSRADNGHRTVYPTGLKIITYNYSSPNPQTKLEKSTMPDDREVPLIDYYPGTFGWHVVTPSDRKIFIASNERDAMSIWWATDQLCIALPKGDTLDRQTEILLEQFTDITLWFTPAQRDAMKNIAYSLSAPKISYIMAAERPFEMLRKNLNKRSLCAVLQNGCRIPVRDGAPPKGLFSQVAEKKEDILESLSSHGSSWIGVAQWQRFSILNTILGGFREGEITVLTGPTGHGKTTFLCEYALDLLHQGIRTLFCSFEMSDTQILYWMAVQFHRGMLNKNDVDKQVDQFTRSNKGLVMMNTGAFRHEPPGLIAEAIRQEVLSAGVQHVVIDNLHFLLSAANLTANGVRVNSSLDKWALQDSFLHQMRRLADETRVHITMVVHPRKEPDDVSVQSFSGSAKVAHEADNVFVIQKRKRGEHLDGRPIFTKFLYIMKNRYTGNKVEYDRLEMKFDRNSFCHRLEDRDQDK